MRYLAGIKLADNTDGIITDVRVVLHRLAQAELEAMPELERDAMTHAIESWRPSDRSSRFRFRSAITASVERLFGITD